MYGIPSTQEQLANFRDAADNGVAIVLVDTCLSSFLNDHHNRDGECLFGVYVDGSMTVGAVRKALVDEIRQTGDRVPEYVTDEMIDKAIDSTFDGDLAVIFDSRLDSPPNEDDFEDDDDGFDEAQNEWEMSEQCQAWFVLTWPVPDEESPS